VNWATDARPLGSLDNPLQVAIVGSGPAGFYAAEALLKLPLTVRVSMLERLPVPFGLVRHGVAPDHPKLKLPTLVFDKIAHSPGYAFFGNVMVGRDISVAQLQASHHAIVFAYGAEKDRRLGLANEDIPGSHTATEFVAWYNGHPDYRDCIFDLSGEVAVIIGNGNVAVDVARILAKPVDELRLTDMAEHALDGLSGSRVREIHIVGRRGPAQANFTTKELRELGGISGWVPVVSAADLQLGATCRAELAQRKESIAAGNMETLRSWLGRPATSSDKRIVFHFLKSPVMIRGDGHLQQVSFEHNRLIGSPFAQVAQGTGHPFELAAGLMFRSIGYLGLPLPGVPFDASRGVIPNEAGRVSGTTGLYATGWIKRGPSGIIGTNRVDAVATVQTLIADLALLPQKPKPGSQGLTSTLSGMNIRAVSYDDWLRIDAQERALGASKGKPRYKFARIDDMLASSGVNHEHDH
jgi:NADPH-dependent glutamate synthase beta subunit-like oxidoreductase